MAKHTFNDDRYLPVTEQTIYTSNDNDQQVVFLELWNDYQYPVEVTVSCEGKKYFDAVEMINMAQTEDAQSFHKITMNKNDTIKAVAGVANAIRYRIIA